ncbi:MAG: excinuclease ABC subunit UvrA [Candidatus Babeliales bacterium]|nr:excinuclease ABC subunit UvrA [Candidatus Babeliales bacterium]
MNDKNKWIKVIGAREHNLKNINVDIPKNKLTIITGPSGSGKSSLALDILFTEGKRRYVESLSAYARQFLGISKKPNVDRIDGLCPAIAIEQKTVSGNPRSTVGTTTEIYDYLRVLFARIGIPNCYNCKTPITQESPEKINTIITYNFYGQNVTISAPIAHEKKGEFVTELTDLFEQGYYRFLIDGQLYKFRSLEDINNLKLKKTLKHTIDVAIDSLTVSKDESARLQEAIEKAFKMAGGKCKIVSGETEQVFSSSRMCATCGFSFTEIEPRLFSFNSPIGACKTCHGLGVFHDWPWKEGEADYWKTEYPEHFGRYAQERACTDCNGLRLSQHALSVLINGKHISELCNLSIKDLLQFFKDIKLDEEQAIISKDLIKEIISRLTFLFDVGLPYLSLSRQSKTLSGGESQRIRLATQIGSSLSGVLYILDEPSIGLHQRDNDRLINTLKALRDLDNTVLVVEHDMDTIMQSDYLIDMGPAAGVLGGEVTAFGTPSSVAKNKNSLTGAYLSGKKFIAIPEKLRTPTGFLTLKNATTNNLKNLEVKFPLGVLCGISGVSGSGKSTLIMEELVPAIQTAFIKPYSRNALNYFKTKPTDSSVEGAEKLLDLVVIDQSPIGRTPRSNPATYLGIFDDIRALFANLPESNARGYKVGRFSFNVAEGRCFECEGDGVIKVTMHFLPDVIMQCKTCKGRRYNAKTLEIKYKGKNIADILDMTAYEALQFFAAHNTLSKRLQLMCDVGLDYIALGQSSTTLSGGEAQRIKLVKELAKRGNKTMYILDEPTTGLHNNDIEKLLKVLNRLIDKGNSIIVIEHNLDVLKTVDYLIDLGPEGGDQGGTIVAQGTPAQVAKSAKSHTGSYLKSYLSK